MPADPRSPRLAVLIDADNIPARHIEAVLDEIAGLGEPSVRRVYGDWSSQALAQWKDKARSLGLVMHQQSANTKGKNASDIGLVIDAMDILHLGKVDGFVLVSSDSDFTRLASRIREDGLQVIGVGEKKTPESLRNVCNRFIFLENLTTAPEPATDAPTPAKPAKAEKDAPSKAIPLILAAMKKIGVEEDAYSLGQLGNVLVQLYPDFDSRSYGSQKLSDLLKRTGRFDVTKGEGNRLIVRDKA
ncbi:NYN domain-containing protein [Tabrizicola sp.]|jgi:predicted nuclease of predicted toxin-antitoxin system|uniref:NYN domain-containing protein n=1 Tax=Tabrizicola sp. TaxID=2005166 RepID=UPI001A46ECC4|nr:NYN domain-containing protein [Tabrizicola sp.]MBL9064061.1 NYN domain-containing protein [Tabrizicola sp.]